LLDVSPTSNGGEIARFKSDTTNGAADVLIVDQDNSSTRAALQVQGNAGSTECLFVGSNGNVGIGTTSPANALHVVGNDEETSAINTATATSLEVAGNGTSTNSGGTILFSAASGSWKFAAIKALVQSGTNNTVGDLAFSTRPVNSDSTLTEAMRITSEGYVGIGTTTPGRLLTVAGDAEFNVVGSSNTSKGIVINSSGTNFESDDGIIQATHAGSGSLTGGYWLKFNANSADKFTVRGDGRTEISSTTGGVILPRMSTSNRTSISSPANGEMVYDTDLNKFYGYASGAWVALH
jgi:hypothetical protein